MKQGRTQKGAARGSCLPGKLGHPLHLRGWSVLEEEQWTDYVFQASLENKKENMFFFFFMVKEHIFLLRNEYKSNALPHPINCCLNNNELVTREAKAQSDLVNGLLTVFVLLRLLLHLLSLFNVIDECEEVAQVEDERLRLDERRRKK